MLPASQRDVSEPGDPGEYTQGGETQPPDTQFKHSDFLIYAYNLANNPERPQDTQASALITALLDHAKLAARVAWELNKYDGNIDQAGFERVRRDLGGSCAVLEGALIESLAEFSPASSPSTEQDKSQDVRLPSTIQDTLELNLSLTQLPRLRDSLVADLPALLLGDLENMLMPRLLAKLQPALVNVLGIPPRTPNIHDHGHVGRYSCPTTNQHPASETHPSAPRAHAVPSAPRVHPSPPAPCTRTDATTPPLRAHTPVRPLRAHFSESPMDDRRYVDDPLMALSGFVWDGSLPKDSDVSSRSTLSLQARRASEGMAADRAPEAGTRDDTRGKRRRSKI
ncbi:hypothetical protein VTO73DRAFT_13803 [Trametes versicolor]